MQTVHAGPLFARRSPRLLIVGSDLFGVNFHRQGTTINGISVSGLPRSGGTTVCWGRMRARCESIDADPRRLQWRDTLRPDAWIRCLGPVMVRIGSDF